MDIVVKKIYVNAMALAVKHNKVQDECYRFNIMDIDVIETTDLLNAALEELGSKSHVQYSEVRAMVKAAAAEHRIEYEYHEHDEIVPVPRP